MQTGRWGLVVSAVLVLGLGVGSGCKRSRAGSRSGVGENVGGVTPSDIYGDPLAPRPGEGGQELAGQFEAVFFDYDSSQVNESERGKIERVADELRRNATAGIIVEGHCDERGSNEYNLALGERRALAVRAYLMGLGIDAGRVQTKSYGEERPSAMGHDEESWRMNRRGEFVLFY